MGGGEVVGEEDVNRLFFLGGDVSSATVVFRTVWWDEVISLEVVSHHGGLDLFP